jgi:pimeloyl-ACP methyl ester carboxylesterase
MFSDIISRHEFQHRYQKETTSMLRRLLKICIPFCFMLQSGFAWSPVYSAEEEGIPVFLYGKDRIIKEWLMASGFPDRLRDDPSGFFPPSIGYDEDYLTSAGGEENIQPVHGMHVRYGEQIYIFGDSLERNRVSEKPRLDSSGSIGDVSYAYCRIFAEEEGEAWLHVVSPWYCRVWLNGDLLYSWDRNRVRFGGEAFRVELRKGYNDLLLKFVSFDGRGEMVVSLTDFSGARHRVRNTRDPSVEVRMMEMVRDDSDSRSEGATSWRSKVLVDLRSAKGLFTDVGVRILAVDVYERTVAEAEGILGEPIEIKTSEGSYRVYAFVKDFFGRRMTGDAGFVARENLDGYAVNLVVIARKIQARSEQDASKGWIDYLATKVENGMECDCERDAEWELSMYELEKWLCRLEQEPEAWARQLGWFEWAYFSKADECGQPFLIQVPENYNPLKKWPLIIDLHGGGSDHLYYPWRRLFGDDPLAIHLSVLGRGRGGYRALAEVDVLEAMTYVCDHWSIDPERIHLSGHSMGGSGTFWVGSRHPDRFASVRPMAGFGTAAPVENLAHVHMYTIHGMDDSVVPVSESRALTRRLKDVGGTAVLEEPTEAGHPLWRTVYRDIRAVCERTLRHLRVKKPRSVTYTAMDEIARKAYWAEVAEWGPEGKPAYLRADWNNDSRFSLSLRNVNVLKIDLNTSPVDSTESVIVEVDGSVVGEIKPPLTGLISVARRRDDWILLRGSSESPEKRLHFPGGAMALYHGEPMMVVYGTLGDPSLVASMRRMAEATSRSSRPGWPFPEPWEDRPRMNMPVGGFTCKPDTAVSGEDMKAYNLFLIGSTDQNTVAALLAPGMPVSVKEDSITTSDGFSWSFRERAFGILYLNHLYPDRLVYWAASSSKNFYSYLSPLIGSQNMTAPPDFVLMDDKENRCVVARRFDSRWDWEESYKESPFLKQEECTQEGLTRIMAEAISLRTGADFALLDLRNSSLRRTFYSGKSRYKDMLAWEYDQRVSLLEISGEMLSVYVLSLGDANTECRFLPVPNTESIQPERMYSIAMLEWRPNSLTTYILMNSDIFPEDGGYIRDALEDFFSSKDDKAEKIFR